MPERTQKHHKNCDKYVLSHIPAKLFFCKVVNRTGNHRKTKNIGRRTKHTHQKQLQIFTYNTRYIRKHTYADKNTRKNNYNGHYVGINLSFNSFFSFFIRSFCSGFSLFNLSCHTKTPLYNNRRADLVPARIVKNFSKISPEATEGYVRRAYGNGDDQLSAHHFHQCWLQLCSHPRQFLLFLQFLQQP